MMYKHWEKILLAMTGFFWGACNAADNSTVTKKVVSKELSKIDASKLKPVTKDTLNIIKDSSNLARPVPIYGINPSQLPKVPCAQQSGNFIVKCLNDVICVDEKLYPGCAEKKPAVAANSGTIAISKKKYTCDNGRTYTEAEFKNFFTVVEMSPKQ